MPWPCKNVNYWRHPIIKWAQRKDKIYIEIGLRDIVDEKIDLTENSISFEGTSDSKKYSFSFELFDKINTEESKWTKTGFHLLIVLSKAEKDKPFWSRLTKDTAKNQYIQIDWSKWVDEDEEEEEGDKGLGGFDPSQMQGFPGMGGMGGMGGFPGMGGMGGEGDDEEEEEEGNIDDLDKPEEVEEKSSAWSIWSLLNIHKIIFFSLLYAVGVFFLRLHK